MRIAPILLASLAVVACSDVPTSPTGSGSRPAPSHLTGALISATFTDLGTLPGGTLSEAFGVNDAGLVVGYSRVPSTYTTGYAERAFRWTAGGGMEELGTLSSEVGWDWAHANAVNNAGQIVGWSNATTRYQRAVLWSPGSSTPIDLGSLGGVASLSLATAINDAGQVVGQSVTATGAYHAFLWTPTSPGATTGTMLDLGTLPGGTNSAAAGINADGLVVGRSQTSTGEFHAVLWTPGTPVQVQDLGTLGGANSVATAINTQGQVVGRSDLTTPLGSAGTYAFLWTPSGGMQSLDNLPTSSDGVPSQAAAINDEGQVAGNDGYSPWASAWQWSAADGMQDLGPTDGSYPDRQANAINENGLVAGAAATGSAARHAALWSVTIAPPAGRLPIAIDVAPGDGTNTISLKDSRDALVAVAVLTTPTFDAPRLVIPASARIGSTPVAARKKGTLYASSKDVDLDGDLDLVLHFERAQLIANGDLTAATTSLVLRADLTDGRQVEGRDAVRVIKR